MIILDYQADHAREIINGHMNKGAPQNVLGMRDFADDLVVPEMSFTGVAEQGLVCCAGINPLWEGVGEAWVIASSLLHENRMAVVRATKRLLWQMITHQNFWRVQACVRTDWPEAMRYAEFFGMQNEGVMKRYGPDGSDYYRYAWVKECLQN
jgi:hypothetical protein